MSTSSREKWSLAIFLVLLGLFSLASNYNSFSIIANSGSDSNDAMVLKALCIFGCICGFAYIVGGIAFNMIATKAPSMIPTAMIIGIISSVVDSGIAIRLKPDLSGHLMARCVISVLFYFYLIRIYRQVAENMKPASNA